jgi:predicted DNA-binding transcriptional regulator AlpA
VRQRDGFGLLYDTMAFSSAVRFVARNYAAIEGRTSLFCTSVERPYQFIMSSVLAFRLSHPEKLRYIRHRGTIQTAPYVRRPDMRWKTTFNEVLPRMNIETPTGNVEVDDVKDLICLEEAVLMTGISSRQFLREESNGWAPQKIKTLVISGYLRWEIEDYVRARKLMKVRKFIVKSEEIVRREIEHAKAYKWDTSQMKKAFEEACENLSQKGRAVVYGNRESALWKQHGPYRNGNRSAKRPVFFDPESLDAKVSRALELIEETPRGIASGSGAGLGLPSR